MGNSDSREIAAASAASDAVSAAIKKQKRRAKRLGCCCCWMNVAAVVALAIGIALLALYGSSFTAGYLPEEKGMQKQTAQGIAYTGVAFLILGLLLLLIGIIIAVVACTLYRRLTGKDSKPAFKHKHYAPGTAPYPQQDWGDVPNPNGGQAPTQMPSPSSTGNPDAPLIQAEVVEKQRTEPAASPEEIRPEVS